MRVVILCGGKGTRIRELSESIPKPMVAIGGRPILWHVMKIYDFWGWRNFILCLGYKGDMIKDYFLRYRASVCDITVETAAVDRIQYHDCDALEDWRVTLADTGMDTMTGGRIARVERNLEDDDDFMVTYADGLADINIEALIAFHRKHGKMVTVTAVHPAGRFGELELANDGVVTAFAEKPQVSSGRINGGFFVIKRKFVESYLSNDVNLILEREPLKRCAEDGQLMAFKHDGYWQPMDTYREYSLLNERWDSGTAPWRRWE